MTSYYYDLHIHSCLSPCADNDMTPNNIAGMAVIKGLNILALTDHNSAKNCPAFFEACKSQGIIPIAGMELSTAEDIHLVCLFEDLNDAMRFDAEIEKHLIPIKNRPEIFGEQLILDGEDEIVRFYIARKHAIIKKGDHIFFTRTIDSEYIDYERIIPKENDIFVTVDKERVLDGLERANIIAEEKIKGSGKSYVKLSVFGQMMLITSTSVNGNVYDEMDCVHEGGDIEIGFNCRYLINSIRVSEGENIKITFKSANQAITIEPCEKSEEFDFFYMILPVRMNDAK